MGEGGAGANARHRLASPTVAIGLPVRNGLPYLAESLEALRAQEHRALEILICDNGSTDATEEVCRAAAASDERITYRRFEENVGASANFNRAFELTSAELFSWAAHDDRFLPPYVAACVESLLRRPDCLMAVPAVRFIDEDGRVLGELAERQDLSSDDLATRLRAYLDRHEWFSIYGVARRSTLASTTLLSPEFGPDVVLMWQVLLSGPVCVLEQPLVEYRRYRSKTVDSVMQGLLPTGASSARRFPHLGMWRRMWSVSARAEPHTRRVARRCLTEWLFSVHLRDLLFEDLRIEVGRARTERSPSRAVLAVLAAAGMVLVRPTRVIRGLLRLRRRATA